MDPTARVQSAMLGGERSVQPIQIYDIDLAAVLLLFGHKLRNPDGMVYLEEVDTGKARPIFYFQRKTPGATASMKELLDAWNGADDYLEVYEDQILESFRAKLPEGLQKEFDEIRGPLLAGAFVQFAKRKTKARKALFEELQRSREHFDGLLWSKSGIEGGEKHGTLCYTDRRWTAEQTKNFFAAAHQAGIRE